MAARRAEIRCPRHSPGLYDVLDTQLSFLHLDDGMHFEPKTAHELLCLLCIPSSSAAMPLRLPTLERAS